MMGLGGALGMGILEAPLMILEHSLGVEPVTMEYKLSSPQFILQTTFLDLS